MSIDREQIDKAVSLLEKGGVIVFPTETSYGLGCDATNHSAVARVAKMKNRPADHPMVVVVDSYEMAREYTAMDDTEHAFTKKYWPGPMTLVMKQVGDKLSPWCLRDGKAVGVRISSHDIPCQLAMALGRPIVATSANLHGHPSSYDVATAQDQLSGHDAPDFYLDVGALDETNPPSMIVELIGGELVIHRKGSFKL